MSHIVVNTVAVAVVLGVIVFLHELGHFLVAKFFKVRVHTFSLGFGRRIWGFKRGETDYRLSLLPLGGYVKMAGETPDEIVEGRAPEPGDLNSKPRWQRFLIVLAGPVANFVLAIFILVPVYMWQFPRNTYLDKAARVAAVDVGSPAQKAGVQPFDRIVRFDGVVNPTWEQVETRSAISAGHSVALTVERAGQQVPLTVIPQDGSNGDPLGAEPVEEVVVEGVSPGSPADKAGLQAGDRILAAANKPVLQSAALVQQLRNSDGKAVTLTLLRHNTKADVVVHPKLLNLDGRGQRWMIGANLGSGTVFVHLPLGAAFRQSIIENKRESMLILLLVGRLLSHRASLSSLQGPVGIASLAGQAARQPTLFPLFGLISMISLNLGILNLLPIPVLDGGMILFLLIESTMRRDLSRRVKELVFQAGFVFLVLLMGFVLYNDIVRSLAHHPALH